ncbi:hypothetical protein swp_4918 [Shewanella piezotolerans WP3]|uniref:Uncharacterized protein n=1 Tax=Shewanella piezotolerans (strain WP3 / JCM 13877) TaxID=225849 RepID=B8CV61_SHEPW|nr:hypothetical protein swp_4918 [Shewanella piezotolerans WP3]
MPEPRITISSNSTTCLQRFEFPLNGQTFNAIGIKPQQISVRVRLKQQKAQQMLGFFSQ